MKTIRRNIPSILNTIQEYNFNTRNDISIMGQSLLNFLSYYYNIQQGMVFFLNHKSDQFFLSEIARISNNDSPLKRKEFQLNQGIIGSCFSHKCKVIIKNLPKGYAPDIPNDNAEHPTQLVCIPIQKSGLTLGVLELASVKPLKESNIRKIEKMVHTMVDETLKVLVKSNTEQLKTKIALTRVTLSANQKLHVNSAS